MGIGPAAFAGRCALVTGAAQGIGEGIARLLAARGARVALVDRLPGGENAAAAIRAAGCDARFFHCDIVDAAAFEAALDAAEAALGPIDILVNNAAHVAFGIVPEISLDEWD